MMSRLILKNCRRKIITYNCDASNKFHIRSANNLNNNYKKMNNSEVLKQRTSHEQLRDINR